MCTTIGMLHGTPLTSFVGYVNISLWFQVNFALLQGKRFKKKGGTKAIPSVAHGTVTKPTRCMQGSPYPKQPIVVKVSSVVAACNTKLLSQYTVYLKNLSKSSCHSRQTRGERSPVLSMLLAQFEDAHTSEGEAERECSVDQAGSECSRRGDRDVINSVWRWVYGV